MNQTKNVLQAVVNFESAESVLDLKNLIQSQVGDVDIIRYSVHSKYAILYVEAQPSENIHTIQIEVPAKTFTTINVVESIVELGSKKYTGTVQEAFAEEKTSEPKAANVIIFDQDPLIAKLLTQEFKLSNISVYDGLVSVSTDDEIIIIEPQVKVTIDYSTYNSETGTVKLIQTDVPTYYDFFNNDDNEDDRLLVLDNLSIDEVETVVDVFNKLASQIKEEELKEKSLDDDSVRGIALIEDIINTFDCIENDLPYQISTPKTEPLNEYERNVQAMKNILIEVKELGESISMESALREDISHATVKEVAGASQSGFVDVDDDMESLSDYSIGDTIVETVTLKVALISFNSFDEYAANHNIVGWDLFTPTTLLIKYSEEGVTSEEKIKKFHEMMDSLDIGWVQQTSSEAKFLTEFKQVLERDVTQEFLARVKKHNIFVRENLAKIRSALLDMEKDYEELKDEVNLTIDWEKLTAYASKKERTEHRTKGVEVGYTVEDDGKRSVNGKPENIVRVNTGKIDGDFYIPVHLLSDELREKYVLDNYVYYINDVPDYAFYEVHVNGHVMIIEKTDL